MAKDLRKSNAAVNAGVNAECALANSGYIRLYSGTRPATVDTAITDQVLLASPRFGATAFGDASEGVATANAITAGTGTAEAGAEGLVPTWYRVFGSDGTTAIWDGTVGVADSPSPGDEYNCELDVALIKTGQTVNVTANTHTGPKASA
jgi:hypothetical protein